MPNIAATSTAPEPRGDLIKLGIDRIYRIWDVDRLPPFLMTIVGGDDHWLFVSSKGALTAGRRDSEWALFPYETEDRLHRAAGQTGPFTLLRCERPGGAAVVWEPFAGPEDEAGRRTLDKTPLSHRVRFEERRTDLGLTFAYEWGLSDAYGFVRKVTLSADEQLPSDGDSLEVDVLDGLRYLMPHGIGTGLQERSSVLGDAYKHSELDEATGLGIYSLTSLIVDRPEPAESLRASVAWSTGLPEPVHLLSTDQIDAFKHGRPVQRETLSTGRPGDYLLTSRLTLQPGQSVTWYVVADVALSQSQTVELTLELERDGDLAARIETSVAANRRRLRALVARADGLQVGADTVLAARHAANVLFNCMRGGVFAEHHVPTDDLADFLSTRNRAVYKAHRELFDELPDAVDRATLLEAAAERGDPSLVRLCSEYLPLTFSRRHGDPSRPWNRFQINVRKPDGSRRLDYEGNWRDVFQNWEALCLSYPDFIEATIAVFVNASTVDGFNPYRLMRAGIDWEAPDPDDPWAHIGYWGDHQIVYLLKLLEASKDHHRKALRRLLTEPVFAYADVPYRLRPYEALVADPHNTIDYDEEHARAVEARAKRLGGDGRLVSRADGVVLHVTLAEKLLVPLLSKLSNLVVDGGIWMNTQRPEWNDANNALVGYGISMVTHAYMHRYVLFLRALFDELGGDELTLSKPVAEWLGRVGKVLGDNRGILDTKVVSDEDRRRVLDALGRAFGDYRAEVYANPGESLASAVEQPLGAVADLLDHARTYLEHGLRAARRDDGLFHAYSLLDLSEPGLARVEHLWQMLEGQVAVLSTDLLDASDVGALVDALFESDMYWPEQHTFLLYPARRLPRFLERNVVPADRVESNALLTRLIEAGDGRVITRDARGDYRFQSDLRNADDLDEVLGRLADEPAWADLVASERRQVLAVWEAVFTHRSFTGRSGTMYGYEGLGSVYWHMVSKLILAVEERVFAAVDKGVDRPTGKALAEHYYRVRKGLGFNKTVAEFGVFPTDPYSHTPPNGQARQPGMTGQVKEDIISRRGELGVRVVKGRLWFDPILLRRREFLREPTTWRVVGLNGQEQELALPAGSLGFTVCQVPVVYTLADGELSIELTWSSGERRALGKPRLSRETSALIFERTGAIARIDVSIPPDALLLDE